ncbi:MAG: NAD(P)/FAD-dependent oxidoreductase [Myxococcota bacterium]|nr:FAD-dependent oxidoreductase [Myxococcales bacterium]
MASIVVVGGGIAGLACAWRLRHAEHDVEVLEAADAPGGRVRTTLVDGYRLERGPAAFGPLDHNRRVLVHALGLQDALHPIEPGGSAVLRRGVFVPVPTDSVRAFFASPLLSVGARVRAARFALDLVRRRGELDLHHPERAAARERGDAATDLARACGVEARDFLVAPVLEPRLGAPLEACSDAFVQLVLLEELRGGGFEAITGGMGRVVDALRDQVAVRCGARVESVETERGGAVVRYVASGRERRVFADAVVIALPADRAAAVCAKLTPEEHGFLASVGTGRALVVHALLDEPPRGLAHYALHVPSQLGLDLARICVEHHKRDAAPPGAGALRIELDPRAVERLWSRDDDRLGARVLEALERTPIGRVRPRRIVVERVASAGSRFAPGALRRLRAFLERAERTPRLAFAGDFRVGPYTEGSLTSGLRAASEVVRALG